MWPLVLGSAGLGALAGGAQGYIQSGGDLSKTLLSAGTGGALGGLTGGLGAGVTRYAGTALAPFATKAAGLTNVVDAPGLFGAAARAASSPLAQTALKTGIPVAAGLGAATAADALLRPAVSGVANLGAQAIGGAGAAGMPGLAPGTPGVYDYASGAVPSTGQFGPTSPYGTPYDVLNPTGQLAGSRLASEKETEAQARNLTRLSAAAAPWMEGRSKAEYLRQMAAAGIRNNLQTQQAALLGGLATSRSMAATAAGNVFGSMGAQYQYQ
jgi:hypothetical protein